MGPFWGPFRLVLASLAQPHANIDILGCTFVRFGIILGSFWVRFGVLLGTLELLRRKTPRKYVASSFSLHLVVAIQELFGDTYYLHGSGAWLIK